TNKMVRRLYCAACCFASSTASRISLTPDNTADRVIKCASLTCASKRAKVVLPTPGGPHKIIEWNARCSKARRSGLPAAKICCCPTYSSKVLARKRAASGWAIGSLLNSCTVSPHPQSHQHQRAQQKQTDRQQSAD